MFRLTREVRFAINAAPDDQLRHRPSNSFGGYPTPTGLGIFYVARVTLVGTVQADTGCLLNIKSIDEAVRDFLREGNLRLDHLDARPVGLLAGLFDHLLQRWSGQVESVSLLLTPYLMLSITQKEHPMMRLSQSFEFAAAHRLHNPHLSDDENRRRFGKCNNPLGHGHNYQVQVTVRGRSDGQAFPIGLPTLERVVDETVITRFDHKHLNLEVAEFAELIPSVENIAKVIYRLLKPAIAAIDAQAALAAVTVWETPKTWCEYSE